MENEKPAPESVPEEKLMMAIYTTSDGRLKIMSPILNDKFACYGLLETVKDYIREQNKPKIVPVGGIMNFARNGHNR